MIMKQFLSLLLLGALTLGSTPLAFARDGSDDSSNDSTDQVEVDGSTDTEVDVELGDDDDDGMMGDDDDDDMMGDDDDDDMMGDDDDDDDDDGIDDELENDVEDAVTDVFENEGELVESVDGGVTVSSEEIEESDLTDEVEQAYEDATESGDYPDRVYLLVQWGYFPATGETAVLKDETVWDGSVNFGTDNGTSLLARPYKLVHFEKDEDSIDFDATTIDQTVFNSTIFGLNDGILFKVKADLSNQEDTKVWFETAFDDQVASAYLQDLIEAGSTEFAYGDYKVVMSVFDHDDWLQSHSEHRGKNHGEKHEDAEQGAWYESYMNYSVDNGFFQGYKDDKGKLNGKIGPGDNLTRFQLLKVMFELSSKLEMGVATSACDPETVTQDSSTDWMGEDWARGYVQCIENSGVDLTVLSDVINGSMDAGNEAALRWEVVVTAFEMLGVDASDSTDSTLTDLVGSGLESQYQDMVSKADELDIVSGYPDGEFKPSKTVNRAEMFKIVSLFSEVFAL